MKINFSLRATSDELLHLDALRFLASAGIVFHHSHEFFYPASARAVLGEASAGLAQFVDLFFVISGFVIAYVYAGRMRSFADFGRFMQRRIGRLIPLHWLTLLASVLVYAAASMAAANVSHAPAFRADCIAATAFLVPAPASCGPYRFNGVSWSIAAEMAMYLLFPLMAWMGARQRWAPLLLGALALLASLGFLLSRFGAVGVDEWVLLPPAVQALPSFLIGVGLWFGRDLLRRTPRPRSILAVALLMMFGAIAFHASAPVVLGSIYIVTAAAIAADLAKSAAPSTRRAAALGQLTYSMYMWHPIFILVLLNALGDKILNLAPGPMIALAVATYALILVWSYLSLVLFENPARRWIDGLGARGRQ